MEAAILIVGCIAVLLLGVVLFKLYSPKKEETDKEEQLERLANLMISRQELASAAQKQELIHTKETMLNSLQMGFRTLAIQKRSNEVWTLLGTVKGEFETFEAVLTDTQKRLKKVDEDLDKLVGVRTRKINRSLRDVETLEPSASPSLLDENQGALA